MRRALIPVVPALAGIACAWLLAEGAVRGACVPALADIRRNHFAWTRVRPNRPDAEGRPVVKPDYAAALLHCGKERRYRTSPCPNPELGHRRNGEPWDQGPVFGVVLGDSMTEGRHVDDSETYVSRLSALSRRRFVNLGRVAPDAAPAGHLRYLRESGFLDARPRVVILQINPSDIHRETGGFVTETGRWRARLEALLQASPLAFHLYHSYVADLVLPPARDPAPGLARIVAAVDEFAALARRRGFEPLVLVDGEDALKPAADRARALGIHLDAAAGPALRVRFDGHFDSSGHEHVARRLLERLRADGALR